METIYFKRGDTRPKVVLAVQDDGAALLDLTIFSTVQFVFKLGATIYTRTGAIESPSTAGLVSYTFLSGDWSGGTPFVAGIYDLEIVLTGAGSVRATVPSQGAIRFVLAEDIS